MKNWADYTDAQGRLGERKRNANGTMYIEQGDGLFKCGHKGEIDYYLNQDANEFLLRLQLHHIGGGRYIRGASPYNDYKITTRDQERAIRRTLALHAKKGNQECVRILKQIWKEQWRRGLVLYPNTKDLDPEKRQDESFLRRDNVFGILDEQLRELYVVFPFFVFPLLPLLVFLDALTFIGTCIKLIKNALKDTYADDNHRIGNLMYVNTIQSTGTSMLSILAYFRLRKIHHDWLNKHPNLKLHPYPRPLFGMQRKHYHDESPPFDELIYPVLLMWDKSLKSTSFYVMLPISLFIDAVIWTITIALIF